MVETDLYIFGGVLIVVWIIQKILIKVIKRASNSEKIPDDVVNGLSVLIKFLMAIIVLYSATIFLDIGESTAVILSIFLGSIISFASINTIRNFVSGMYILITEPFSVNDLVRIGKIEGLVTEMSLNYTSLLNFDGVIQRIPNKSIIGSLIVNFDQKTVVKTQYHGKLGWMKNVTNTFEGKEVTRYVFDWSAQLENIDTIKKKFDEVCKKYEKVFGYHPEYFPRTTNYVIEFSFILKADDPILIIKHKSDFVDDLSAQFH